MTAPVFKYSGASGGASMRWSDGRATLSLRLFVPHPPKEGPGTRQGGSEDKDHHPAVLKSKTTHQGHERA